MARPLAHAVEPFALPLLLLLPLDQPLPLAAPPPAVDPLERKALRVCPIADVQLVAPEPAAA